MRRVGLADTYAVRAGRCGADRTIADAINSRLEAERSVTEDGPDDDGETGAAVPTGWWHGYG